MKYNIFRPNGQISNGPAMSILQHERVATCKYGEDAAALIAVLGVNATIRIGDRVLWREGAEDQPAAESYDHVAETLRRREREST